ncbi:MAG: alpha-L-rhamnosidase, partial [Oscillibacter sp.]|nr:alpha-L-rhamnosidase [Oscillibacter sp.]
YVGVSGIDEADLDLSGLALYADMEPAGTFSCSHEMLNRLQNAIVWGERSNFVEIPTDCPQRDERLGWTGDIALFAPTACYNYDCARFLEKWLLDVKAEQGRGGGIPTIVPQVKIYNQYEMFFTMAIDHWGDCCIWVPWAVYRAGGNREVLRRMYPTMRRYLTACRRWAELLSAGKKRRVWSLGHHYGDWCALDTDFPGWMRRGKWTATACLAYSAGLLAQIADLLGEGADAEEYRRLSRETADAYRTVLLDADGKIRGFQEKTNPAQTEFLTAYVLPLYYGLLEGEQRKRAAGRLAALVREGGWHVTTGFPGTPYLLFALLDNGYVEDAYRTLLNDTCPSWLYEIKAGGTTTWERWDALREDGTVNAGGGGGMVSFNHYAAGAVGDFLYRRVLGIEPLEGGYRTFRAAPVPGGGLTWAKGTVRSAYGTIEVSWRLQDGQYHLDIQVPMGSVCQVVLPDGTTERVGSGKHHYEWSAEGAEEVEAVEERLPEERQEQETV